MSQQGRFRTRSYGMSAGVLLFFAILGKLSTNSRAFPFWLSRGATTEPGTRLLKSRTLRPDVDAVCAHACISTFHSAVNMEYAYFPMYMHYWTCVRSKTAPSAKENGWGSKDQTAHSTANRTQSTMRQCVSAISGPDWGGLGGSPVYLPFPIANWTNTC